MTNFVASVANKCLRFDLGRHDTIYWGGYHSFSLILQSPWATARSLSDRVRRATPFGSREWSLCAYAGTISLICKARECVMSRESIIDPRAQSATANSIFGNSEADRTGLPVAVPVLPRVWSKLGRVTLTLVLIAVGVGAPVEFASGQQKQQAAAPKAAPKFPAAVEAPASAPVVAAPGPEKVNTALAWTVNCFSSSRLAPADCKIEQRLFAKETGRGLSVATIEIPGATRQPVLVLHLPNGLALQDGVSLAIDNGTATPLLWQSCDGNGCYATLILTPALIETMKTGKVMAVKVSAANREPLTFQHLLTDFAAAYEAAK